jgi:hypothetical protein
MPDTGAPYNIPYLGGTELVRDYPDFSEDLADAIVAALEAIPVYEKRIAAFTGSGTWTVPTGVTYAIAHMLGGGGGIGQTGTGAAGSASSVDFASGLVSSSGAPRTLWSGAAINQTSAGPANSGRSATIASTTSTAGALPVLPTTQDAQWIVAGAAVTPAASISVTVGAGGTAGTNGAAGGSGYVYIEYYEEV